MDGRRPLRSFEELKSLLSGKQALPPSKFVSYKLPLSLQQLRELEPLLKENAQLKGLRLKGCGIDDAGADVLSSAIAFNTALERLELPGNKITGAGALFLCNALRSFNTTLRALDLHDNPCLALELDTMTEIAQYLARNTSRAVRAASPQAAISPFRIREVPCLELPAGPSSPPSTQSHSGQLESRVLHLESDFSAQAEDIENLKQLGEELSGWKNQLDVASGQMADVLMMLKGEIDELKDRAAALERAPRAAAAVPAGPDATALLTQMQGKWEMLRGSLERLEGLNRPGSVQHDAHKLLVEAVEALTKRLEVLEHASSTQVAQPALEAVRQQTRALEAQLQELHGQQQALVASATPASQLAALQLEVQEALTAGPKVEVALSGLELLRQLVAGISQEVSDTSAAAALTSQNVAALADTFMQLQQQMERQQQLEATVERLTAETSIAVASSDAASCSVRTIMESQGELQQQVGKLQLDVSTLEHELDTLDAPARLAEHEGRLQQLQASQEAFGARLEGQLSSQAGRLQGAEQQLAGLEAQSMEVYEALGTMQAALEGLQAGLQEQPSQRKAAVECAVGPLQKQLEQQERALGVAAEAARSASSQASAAAAGVNELWVQLDEHPGRWQAAVESAVGPLQQQLSALETLQTAAGASAKAAQEATVALSSRLDDAESALSYVSAQTASTAAAVSSLQDAIAQQPSKWQVAVEAAAGQLEQKLGAVEARQYADGKSLQEAHGAITALAARVKGTDEAISSVGAQASATAAGVSELRAELSEQPGKWQAAVKSAVGPLQQQLLEAQQAADGKIAQATQEAAAALGARLECAETAIASAKASISGLPAQWEAAVESAIGPLHQSLAAMEQQHAVASEGVQACLAQVGGRVAAVEAGMAELQSSLGEQGGQWQAELQEAVQPVQAELVVLREQQAEAGQELKGLAAEVAAGKGCMEGRLRALEGAIGNLQATTSSQPSLWQIDIQRMLEPVRTQVTSIQEQQTEAGSQVAALQERLTAQGCELATQLGEVQSALSQHPGLWAAAVTEAVGPLREQLAHLQELQVGAAVEAAALQASIGEQSTKWRAAVDSVTQQIEAVEAAHSSTAGAVQDVADQAALTACALEALQATVAQQLNSLEEVAGKLRSQLDGLAAEQREVGASVQGMCGQVDTVQEKQQQLAQRVASSEAQLKGTAASTDLARLQQELEGQLSNLRESIPEPYDDAKMGLRVEGVEEALAGLQATLADLQAAVGVCEPEAHSTASNAGGANTQMGAAAAQQQQQLLLPLTARLAALLQTVANIQSAVTAATQRGEAEDQAVQQLTAAVRQLGESQAELRGMLEGIGQEQMDLAERVEALPAILAGGMEGASPALTAPRPQSLAHLSPTPASEGLRSFPLLTSSFSDLESDGEDEGEQPGSSPGLRQGPDELKELRLHVTAQTKQIINLEARLAEQAQRHERELQEMRLLVASLVAGTPGSRARPAGTPLSATLPFMRRSFGAGHLPCDTPHGTAYYDASSEAGEAWDTDLASPVPTLSLSRARHQPGNRSSPWGSSGRDGATSPAGYGPEIAGCIGEGGSSPSGASSSADTSFGLSPAGVAVPVSSRCRPLGESPKLPHTRAEQAAWDAALELPAAALAGGGAAATPPAAALGARGARPAGQMSPGHLPIVANVGAELMSDITNSSVGRSRSAASEAGVPKVAGEAGAGPAVRWAAGRGAAKPAAH